MFFFVFFDGRRVLAFLQRLIENICPKRALGPLDLAGDIRLQKAPSLDVIESADYVDTSKPKPKGQPPPGVQDLKSIANSPLPFLACDAIGSGLKEMQSTS